MTTAAHPSVDWVRLTIGDDDFTLDPSPGIELRLSVASVPYDGYVDLLARPPAPQLHMAVDLVPSDAEAIVHRETQARIARCEAQARDVAARLGAVGPVSAPLREFSLEAALGGEGLPYNRMAVPRLLLVSGEPPMFDEDQFVPAVRVFTAKVPTGSGSAYTLTRAT